MHAVEIRRFGEGVSEPMLQMRDWLGRHRIQPALIQFSFLPGKEIRFRLTFCAAGEASLSPKHSRARFLAEGMREPQPPPTRKKRGYDVKTAERRRRACLSQPEFS